VTVDDARNLVRVTRGMTMVIAVSRVTGFVRLAVALAVLGTTTQLGNVYQTANTVPTLLFELFAAGALQAALIPDLVERLDRGDHRGAGRMASSALLAGGLALGALVVIGLAARGPIMSYFMRDVSPAVRPEAEALGEFMLWFFMPQLLLYLAGSVATAVLNAQRRFYAPVFAPLINNVVVIATLGLFAFQRRDRAPSLDLALDEKLVLAGGTTLGVLLFCSLPVVAALGTGFRLQRPLPLRSPEFTGLVRSAGWTISFLALGQILNLVVLPLTNAVAGHTLVWQTSWQVFLLPYALLAVPVLTARFPAMTSSIRRGDIDAYAGYVADGTRSVLTFGLLSGAAMIATGPLIARVIAFGEAAEAVDDLGSAIGGFGAGVAGYGVLMFLARAWFAAGDARTPALIQAGVVAVGAAVMVTLVDVVPTSWRLLVLSLAYASAQVIGAALALVLLWNRHLRGRATATSLPVGIARRCIAAFVAGLLMWGVRSITPDSRTAALAGLIVAAAFGTTAFLAVQRALGGAGPRDTLRSMGGSDPTSARPQEGLSDD
jgi:putative peptidoglycan lipid II flippase